MKSPSRTLKDVDFGSFLLLVLRRIAFLAHGLSAHLDAVGEELPYILMGLSATQNVSKERSIP